MTGNVNKYIYWIPRILSILFICFLVLMSLDIFSLQLNLQQTIAGLFMHNIPAFFLAVVLLVSWKYEIAGGIVYILAGTLYVIQMLINMFRYGFEGYMLSYSLIVAGPAFLVGVLFILNWVGKNHQKDASVK